MFRDFLQFGIMQLILVSQLLRAILVGRLFDKDILSVQFWILV